MVKAPRSSWERRSPYLRGRGMKTVRRPDLVVVGAGPAGLGRPFPLNKPASMTSCS